jgi:hypothetical protein
MNKKQGLKTMRKAIATLIMIAMMSFLAPASDSRSDAEVTLLETALPASTPSPLAALDLFPEPAPKASYAAMNLDPNQVTINPGHRYLERSLNGSAFGDAMFNASLISMVVLNVGDYLSTNEALKYPGLAEGNPMMKPFVKSPVAFAAVKLGFTALSYVSLKGLYKKNKAMAWVASAAANFLMSYVVSNNVSLINMAKGR